MTELERLKLQLKEAKELLKQQDEALRAMSQPPFLLKTVLSTRPGFIVVGDQAGLMEVPWDKYDDVKSGDLLRVSGTGQIVERADPIPIGGITSAIRDAADGELEVEAGHGKVMVLCAPALKVTKGDRVTLDPHGLVVTRNLGKAHSPSERQESTGVCWDDVGGLEDAKAELREALEGPHLHPKIYAAYGRTPPKGVLLWGPPGCGKTMLAKAVATSVAGGGQGKFLYVKGPELLSKWVGESESQVRALFEAAREHRRQTGTPAVIFIDEAESILGGRGRATDGVSAVQSFLVPMFLAEMDGLDPAGAVVLLATNRPTDLDPAVVRDGRVDRKVQVPRPDRVGAEIILGLGFRGCPCADESLASHAAAEVFAESRKLLEVHLKAGGSKTIFLADTVNGGMLIGITQKARRMALMRDVADGRSKPRGVTRADVSDAVNESARELLGTDVSHLVEEAVGDLKGVARVNRAIPVE